jgi:Zn-dependent M28 family amino/carboxypeptidase
LDNAAGVAGLLEVARAFASLPEPPARSVVFVAVTGEEHGLLGSDYFAHNPGVPLDRLVANVNLDSPLLLYPLKDVVAYGLEHSTLRAAVESGAKQLGLKVSPDPMPVVAYGLEHSTLRAAVESGAKQLGLKVSPDPMPEQVFFVRSDQYSFVKRGVPSIYLEVGWETEKGEQGAKEGIQQWLRTRYHSPKDDMSQTINFEAGVELTRLNFLIGYQVATQPMRPAWNPGDFFGETYSGQVPGSR